MQKEPSSNVHQLQPLLLTIAQTAQALNLGRTKVVELIEQERLPTVRFGRAVRISLASLEQWIHQREQNQSGGGNSQNGFH